MMAASKKYYKSRLCANHHA